jgi:hypothetical protein
MPQNLFAACRVDGELIAKRVRLDAAVQQGVEDVFENQEREFRADVTEEVPFEGSWKPDADEFLTIDIPEEAEVFERTIRGNATAVPDIDTGHFMEEGIKALFTGRVRHGHAVVLVQRFTSQQVLSKTFSLFQHGNSFRQLTDTAFTFDSKLTCIVEEEKIKFKSLFNLRSIINMTDLYREATDQEVRDFGSHRRLYIADMQGFLANTSQTSRKLIHAITGSGVLNSYTPQQIQQAAQPTGLALNIEQGRLAMPMTGPEVKKVLQFLNESRYLGPLSQQPYVTNSQRLANGTN